MKIKRITAFIENLQLTKAYEVAYQVTDKVENAFVTIELADGKMGLGAASPSKVVINETIEDLANNLTTDQLQQWEGRDIRHFRQIIAEVNAKFPKHSATRTALDIALHDAFGKFLGIPVLEFYGQKVAPMPTSVTIGISSVEETMIEAKEYLQMGFHSLKVKTGKSVAEDVERCVKLREHFGNQIQLRVDANQGYTAQQTSDFYQQTKHLDLELIEQPMPEGKEAEMRTLSESIRNVIACDESLKNAQSAIQLIRAPRVCGIFNIKLMKCGGLLGAFEIANIAKAANVDLFWGCFDESVVSISAALHAALACANTKYLDLDGSLFLGKDVVRNGFDTKEGILYPLAKPGFGFDKI
ncbi:MAG: dipeptide epimerase [Bacteroidota bacterium]